MKFVQLIKHNAINIFLKNYAENETVPYRALFNF